MNKFEIIAKRCKPLFVFNDNEILVYSKGSLFLLDSSNGTKKKICALPMSFIKSILCKFRIFERMLRVEPRTAVRLNKKNILISYQGGMYRVDLKEKKSVFEHRFRIGVNNPLNMCCIENIKGFSNCFAYGEYSENPNKNEVRIYTRGMNIEDKWKKAYEFSKNTITHIHSIVPDPYRNGVLILTGDEDRECGIWMAQNNFQKVSPLLVGDQQYRSCCAYPIKDGILYATDTPLADNYIYLMKNIGNVWVRKKIKELNGSCVYSTRWKNKFVFSTTVEPDSTIKGKRYWFTYKLGKGIKNNQVEIVVGDLINGFKCIKKYKKDILPMTLFQFGTVQFCKGNENDTLYLYPVAVKKYDSKFIAYREE